MPRKLSIDETIVHLLETLSEVTLPETGAGADKRDSRTFVLSPLYHEGSYRELERCLDVMHKTEGYYMGVYLPKLRWHVVHWHCGPKKIRLVERKTKRGPVIDRFVERPHLPPGVEESKAGTGRRFIAGEFNCVPFLPKEIYQLVAA